MAASAEPPRIEGFDSFEPLGSGGTATVWSARQVSLGREVAVKTLSPELAAGAEEIDRFQSEARTAARLSHPGVVKVFDVFFRDGNFCIVMEKLDGETLARRIARGGPLREAEAVAVARGVASALGHAWKRERLVHRDLKPENVMLCRDGTVKVMDFGLASSSACLRDEAAASAGEPPQWVWGTPAYMSPEQAAGRAAPAPQSDMYSLGATLYHAATGRALFSGEPSAIMEKQVSGRAASPREAAPALSLPFCDFLERLLAKKPEDRFAGWDDVEAVLASLALAPPCRHPLLPRPAPGAAAAKAAKTFFSSVAPARATPVADFARRVRAAFPGGASPRFRAPHPAALAALAAAAAVFCGAEAFAASRRAAGARFRSMVCETLDSMPAADSRFAPAAASAAEWCERAAARPDAASDPALASALGAKGREMREAVEAAALAEARALAGSWRAVAERGGPAAAAAAAGGLRAYAGPLAAETARERERLAEEFEAGTPGGRKAP